MIRQYNELKKRLNYTATRLARYLHSREWIRARHDD